MDNVLYGALLSAIKQFGVSGIDSITEKSHNPTTGESVLTFAYKDSTGVARTTDYTVKSGKDGTNITGVSKVGNDIVFTLSDSTTQVLTNAYVDLKGVQGDKGEKGDNGLNGTFETLTQEQKQQLANLLPSNIINYTVKNHNSAMPYLIFKTNVKFEQDFIFTLDISYTLNKYS